MHEPKIELLNMDCLLYMKQCEDKQFDWAIVDPPYGINFDGNTTVKGKGGKASTFANTQHHEKKGWDTCRPTPEYFAELQRISKNQIVISETAEMLLVTFRFAYPTRSVKILAQRNRNFNAEVEVIFVNE